MKTISKNKIILCLATAVLSITVILVACKKEDSLPTNKDALSSSQNLKFSYSVDGETNFVNES